MKQKYRKKALIEAELWNKDIDMNGVSVSDEDFENGSPARGDMIANNVGDSTDRWLISAEVFKRTYEPA